MVPKKRIGSGSGPPAGAAAGAFAAGSAGVFSGWSSLTAAIIPRRARPGRGVSRRGRVAGGAPGRVVPRGRRPAGQPQTPAT
ncbi:hypothetical protein GCM10009731_65220 [Streptomyces globosus]